MKLFNRILWSLALPILILLGGITLLVYAIGGVLGWIISLPLALFFRIVQHTGERR